MSCPEMDRLEAKFILVRNEQTKVAIKTGKLDEDLERRGVEILGEIMEHQIQHSDCDPK